MYLPLTEGGKGLSVFFEIVLFHFTHFFVSSHTVLYAVHTVECMCECVFCSVFYSPHISVTCHCDVFMLWCVALENTQRKGRECIKKEINGKPRKSLDWIETKWEEDKKWKKKDLITLKLVYIHILWFKCIMHENILFWGLTTLTLMHEISQYWNLIIKAFF